MTMYAIGSQVFILSNNQNDNKIYPANVSEQIIKRSEQGEEVSYIVSLGPQNKRRQLDMKQLDGKLFPSLAELKQYMMSHFEGYVDDLCEKAEQTSEKWYGVRQSPDQPTYSPTDGKIDPGDLFQDDAPQQSNSKQHPLSLPQGQSTQNRPATRVQDAREALKQRLIGDNDTTLDGIHSGDGSVIVELPDGTQKIVRNV